MHIDEQKTYNGFNSVVRYEAKLSSLASLLKPDVEIEQSGHHFMARSYIKKLEPLLQYFVKSEKSINHLCFTLDKAERVKQLSITQVDFSEYIEKAYQSLTTLLNVSVLEKEVEEEFKRLFSGRNAEYDFQFVNNALRDLKIVNSHGELSIGERGKGILWALIDILTEEMIVFKKSEEKIMELFWYYTRGGDKAPVKPHRESISFKSNLKKVKQYFADHYTRPNNDN